MNAAFFFGYGSLVNRRTHAFAGARPARLPGWRRVWRSTTLRDAAFLSAEPAGGPGILGLVAEVPLGDWPALDAREAAYRRHDVSHHVRLGPAPAPAPVALPRVEVYSVDPALARTPCNGPILLSYLDTVAEGFRDIGGAAAVAGFFASTDGWNRAVIDDRAAPLYSRATAADAALRAAVDAALAGLAVPVQQLE